MNLGALLQRSLLERNQSQHGQDLAKMALVDAAMDRNTGRLPDKSILGVDSYHSHRE
jgi:hypothetical protein